MTPCRARPWPSLLLLGPTGCGQDPARRRAGDGAASAARRCAPFRLRREPEGPGRGPRGVRGRLSAPEMAAIEASLATGALFEDRDMPMIVRIVERFAAGSAPGPDDILVLNGLPAARGPSRRPWPALLAVRIVVRLDASPGVIRERMTSDPGGDRSGRTGRLARGDRTPAPRLREEDAAPGRPLPGARSPRRAGYRRDRGDDRRGYVRGSHPPRGPRREFD
ncbi:MAG: hypothetical protein M0C28_38990 [Candidatus Moduliflexus flocculans]|nr:hypothetical protein [Candidatus Moduliflexus flocculans]